MKVYVAEQPDSCLHCVFCNRRNYCCFLMNKDVREYRDDCPLQSLADYTKQVRKEAFEELYKFCEEHHFSKYSIDEFLDQTQGE